ncbi:MAG: DUF4974 domain-containing protein [Bacteroidales bacterium]|nr:DUF4974 domain-containing protein [Bacteroidales bacterium]
MVKVLGTSFLIKEDHETVKVFVETGKVSLSKADDEKIEIVLEAGQTGTLSGNQVTQEVSEDENLLSWKTGKIVLNGQTFEEIASILEHAYGVKIKVVNAGNGNCPHTDTFQGQSLESVLKVLSEFYQFSVLEKKGKLVIDLMDCKEN